MAARCPNCDAAIDESDTYCWECGTSIDSESHSTGSSGERAHREGSRETGRGNGSQGRSAGWGDRARSRQQEQRSDDRVTAPRKGAIETFVQGIRWMISVPILFGAFIFVELFDAIGEINALFSLLSIPLLLVVDGVAHKYTERLLADESVSGTVAELFDMGSVVLGRLLSLLGVVIIYVVAVAIGLILLIVPGIYLGARLALAFPACVLDEQRAFESLSTSWDVAHGNVLKLVGLFLLFIFAVIGVTLPLVIFEGVDAVDAPESPLALVLVAPITALISGAVEMSYARIYLENREGSLSDDWRV